ncbi:MAG TPA: phasin family protein [Thermoanaerobaculia bacterium]|jgi:poly(hydroxyalkanoate) granule-associated protein|nr:phasin family protein [Thermoanaerobaculia bacterium]
MSEAQTTTPSAFEKARQELLNAGRNLWLASLGAIVEADNASQKLFDRLVERGRPLDERQRKTVDAFTDRANGAMREAGKLVQDTVEYEGKQVLRKMGVMTRDDLRTLSARLDILSRQIDEYAAAKAVAEPIIPTPDIETR